MLVVGCCGAGVFTGAGVILWWGSWCIYFRIERFVVCRFVVLVCA